MDIYIKSFNRPYLLHRTLASIRQYLIGFEGNIVILDDGTPDKYLTKITQFFPEAEIRRSPYYNEKSQAIERKEAARRNIPSAFWKQEVLKGSEHFILLEDDMWFYKQVDYSTFKTDVEKEDMDMIKFMWLENDLLISQKVVKHLRYFSKINPEVFTVSPMLFHAVFINNTFRVKEVLSKLRMVNFNREILRYYHIFIVAGGVFSKKYYENAWENTQNKVDEFLQISQVLKKIKEYGFGHTNSELLKATYKFTASVIDKDRFGNQLDVFEFNSILNEAWFHGNGYDVYEFSEDIPDEWIKDCCTNTKVKYEAWKEWYGKFKESYEHIGCIIR